MPPRIPAIFSLALAALLGASDITEAAAQKRGAPMTDTRFEYCQARQKACMDQVDKDCKDKHPHPGSGRSDCLDGGNSACHRSWSTTGSDCWTRESLPPSTRPGAVIRGPDLPAKQFRNHPPAPAKRSPWVTPKNPRMKRQ